MYGSIKRELLTWFQYLLMGIIAECAVIRWFSNYSLAERMLAWVIIVTALSFARIIILYLSDWLRRDQWQSISKRRWG